jgi:hypothetical protein
VQPTTSKRTYQTPRLQTYGDIREITQNVGNMGNADGGGAPKQKTAA